MQCLTRAAGGRRFRCSNGRFELPSSLQTRACLLRSQPRVTRRSKGRGRCFDVVHRPPPRRRERVAVEAVLWARGLGRGISMLLYTQRQPDPCTNTQSTSGTRADSVCFAEGARFGAASLFSSHKSTTSPAHSYTKKNVCKPASSNTRRRFVSNSAERARATSASAA